MDGLILVFIGSRLYLDLGSGVLHSAFEFPCFSQKARGVATVEPAATIAMYSNPSYEDSTLTFPTEATPDLTPNLLYEGVDVHRRYVWLLSQPGESCISMEL